MFLCQTLSTVFRTLLKFAKSKPIGWLNIMAVFQMLQKLMLMGFVDSDANAFFHREFELTG